MSIDYGEFLRRTVTLFLVAVAFLLIGNAILKLGSLLMLIFACWVFSVGLSAAVRKLRQAGMSQTAAVTLTLGSALLFSATITAIILPVFVNQVADLIEQLPGALNTFLETYGDFRDNSELAASLLPEITLEQLEDIDAATLEELSLDDAASAVDLDQIISSILPFLGGIGSFFGSLLANLFLMITITLYLFASPMVYYRSLLWLVPDTHEALAVRIINEIRQSIVAWMGSLLISILFVSSTTTFILGVILQIPNAIALGTIAGLSSFIPNLGYYIGLIPIVLFTAIHDPLLVIPAFIAYVIINETDGKIIQPRVVQGTLSIPAGVVLPFQIMSASLFGFFGILLAVPILAIFIILVREIYVGELLGKGERTHELTEADNGRLVLVQQPEPMEGSPQ